MYDPSEPTMTKAECLLQEAIDKEMHYLKCLQSMKYGIVQPLIDKIAYGSAILTRQEIEQLFSKNIESFLSLSQVLLVEFLKVQETEDIEATGTIFIQQAEWFKCYKEYVTDLPQRLEFLNSLKNSNSNFRNFLVDAGMFLKKVGIADDLETLLIKPSRVIFSYYELLQGLEKTYKKKKSQSLQQGLAKVSEILSTVDAPTDLSSIEFKKVQELYKRVRGRVDFVEQHRLILHEGTFNLFEMDHAEKGIVKPNKPVLRYVVLFNDALLVAIPYQRQELVMERYLPLTAVSGEIFISGEVNDNSILKVVTFGYTYYFGCPDQIERDLWLSTLHRALAMYETQPAVKRKKTPPTPKSVTETSLKSRKESEYTKTLPIVSKSTLATKDERFTKSQSLTQVRKRAMWRRGVVNTDGIRQTMNITSATYLILEIVAKYNKAEEKFKDMDSSETIPFFIGTSGAVIGRNIAANDHRGQVLINDDTGMSRMHAEIEYDYGEKRFSVRDLGSANNTIIISGTTLLDGVEVPVAHKMIGNKGRIGKWFPLKENFIFQLGGTRFKATRIHIKTEQAEPTPDPFASSKQSAQMKKDGNSENRPKLQAEQTVIIPGAGVESVQLTHLWDEPKRVVVVVRRGSKQRLVGAVVVEQGQTWQQVRRKIFDGLLRSATPNQRASYQLSQMSIFLNGTIPIPESQDDEQVYGFIENRDQIVVEIMIPQKK